MLSARMIPMLWIRLAVLIGFTAFVAFQQMWIITLIAVAMFALTVWQLLAAYRSKEDATHPISGTR